MYMYKPEYKNEKYCEDNKKNNIVKSCFVIMGYAALSMLLVGVPMLLN
jgi:hypothetical protein